MTQRIITAAFDSREDAEKARSRLETMGIPASNIRIIGDQGITRAGQSGTGSPSYAGQTGVRPSSEYTHYDTKRDEKGFWASLGELFMPDEDRSSYAEAMNRGGVVLSVTTDEQMSARVEDVLDDEGTINLDEREQSWRSEGWQGHSKRTDDASDTMGGAHARTSMGSSAGTSEGLTSGAALGGETHSRSTSADQNAIPIVEEQLNIGKRVENSGRVRVRSYVVERPVSEQVSLRQESVSVERRPVDRELRAGEDAFQDRTIEATETSERAVIDKEARVTGEVVLNKQVENRTETVSDTVRKTEVDVDDDRSGQRTSGQPASRKPDPMAS